MKKNTFSPQIQNITQTENSIFQSEYLRQTSEYIPSNQYEIKTSGIPFGIHITPFPYSEKSKNNIIKQYSFGHGNGKISRCMKCKAFINSYCIIEFSGWRCNICNTLNPKDDNVQNTVENILSGNNIFEIFANSDYIENSPMSSNYVFIIDVTFKNIKLGVIKIFSDCLKFIFENNIFQNEDRTYISFITFDYDGVYFFKINKNGNIQIFNINGDEAFIPDSEKNLLISFDENKDNLINFINSFESLYDISKLNEEDDKEINNFESDCLLFAIECGKVLLENKGGKIIVINSTIDWTKRVSNINHSNNFYESIDKEKKIESLGKVLTKYKITCDIFQIQNKKEYLNVLDLSDICSYSNGCFYLFKNFNLQIHEKNIFNTLIKCIQKQKAFEVLLQIYFPLNIELSQCLSKMPLQVDNDFLLSNIDIEQTFSFIFDYKSKDNSKEKVSGGALKNQTIIFFQFSIIYTNIEGIRLIRVFNLKVPVCSYDDYLKNIDNEAYYSLISKLLINKIYESKNISNSLSEINQLYLMNSLNFMAHMNYNELLSQGLLYYLGFMKNKIFCIEPQKFKLNPDEINFLYKLILKQSINEIMTILIPKIYDLNKIFYSNDSFENISLNPIQLSMGEIKKDSIYLMDNGQFFDFHITFGPKSKERIKLFFGDKMTPEIVGTYFHNEISVFEDNINKDNFEIESCNDAIGYLRYKKCNLYQDVFFSFEGTLSENIIKSCMILDDFCPWFSKSYGEWMKKLKY